MKFDVRLNIPAITEAINKVASKVIREATFSIKQKMLVSFAQSKSGRIYKRGNKTHQASARGEAPAIDTGFLANSIQTEFPNRTTGIVTVGAEYGRVLEEILDRPFVRPAIDKTIDDLNAQGITGGFVQ